MSAAHRCFILFTALGALFVASTARADVAPPPGYVEQCVVEKQQAEGEECYACGKAWHGDPDACKKLLGEYAFSRRCQTRGASVWGEVWCRTGPSQAAMPPDVLAQVTPADPEKLKKEREEKRAVDSEPPGAAPNAQVTPAGHGACACEIGEAQRGGAAAVLFGLAGALIFITRRRRSESL